MEILIIMCIGAVAGRLVVPARLKKPIELAQVACTALLIFTMGLSLGGDPDFFRELGTLGAQSLVFCLAPMVFSIAIVYALTSWLMGDGTYAQGRGSDAVGEAGRAPQSIGARIVAFLREEAMVAVALVALVAGLATGIFAADAAPVVALLSASDQVLDVLMLLVGVSVGMRRGLVASIREHHVKTLVIPAGVVVGSLLGGVLGSLVCGYGLREGLAVASGLGWYSLAGVTIEGLAGAQLGAIAFLASLLREIFSFFSIPAIARHLNYYSCIAAAAATSEDTTLPMMIRYTDERTVVFSLVNGIICSACVPPLIAAFLG